MPLFNRRTIHIEPEPQPQTLDSQLAELDMEKQRWEGLIETTTIGTDIILTGLKDVAARRAELLDLQNHPTAK